MNTFKGGNVKNRFRVQFLIPARSTIHTVIEIVNPVFSNSVDEGQIKIFLKDDGSTKKKIIKVGISYEVLDGKLTLIPVSDIRFSPSIPGVSQSRDIFAKSTFSQNVEIKSIMISDPTRVEVEIVSDIIEPGEKVQILKIS